jgi:hypothetical protein
VPSGGYMLSISFDNLAKLILAITLILICLTIAFIRFAVKTVPENKRVVVFRVGKCLGSRGPGIETEILGITQSKRSDELIKVGSWIEGQLKDALYRSSRSWGFDVVKISVET